MADMLEMDALERQLEATLRRASVRDKKNRQKKGIKSPVNQDELDLIVTSPEFDTDRDEKQDECYKTFLHKIGQKIKITLPRMWICEPDKPVIDCPRMQMPAEIIDLIFDDAYYYTSVYSPHWYEVRRVDGKECIVHESEILVN
jgi:hypothetical protein